MNLTAIKTRRRKTNKPPRRKSNSEREKREMVMKATKTYSTRLRLRLSLKRNLMKKAIPQWTAMILLRLEL
jgi:hypothetical protein